MSALVRRIRRLILGDLPNKNAELKDALEELGIEDGAANPVAFKQFQQIILNSGRDSEVLLRRAMSGLGITGGGTGGGEVGRIRQALLRDGRLASLRSAIDDLVDEVGGFYSAPAVNFDGSTFLSGDVTAVDSSVASFSFWVKSGGSPADLNLWVADVNSGDQFIKLVNTDRSISISLDAAAGNLTWLSATNAFPANAWFHLLIAMNVGLSAGNKIVACYVNDTLLVPDTVFDETDGFSFEVNGGTCSVMGEATIEFEGDAADIWIAPNVSLLSGSAISEANRRKFIDETGKPVNPSNFPASAILFSGNAASFGTNQGSGGTFTITGTLTNASTSPSD